jgi:HEAT repeat protein
MGLFTPNLRRLEKADDIPGLLKCLSHRKAEVRYSAFVALAGMKDPGDEIMDRMRDMVRDPDPWVKTIAILKFAELGDASISDNLMEIIVEGSRNAKLELLKIITWRGAADDRDIMEVIINALADRQEIVRRQAIIAAGATGNRSLLPHLAENLHEKHHDLRVQVARALYNIGGNESIDYLIGLLADNDPEVAAEARSCLSFFKIEYVQKVLHDSGFIQLIKGMNGREPARRETALKIGEEGIREGLPLLHRACGDRYKSVRIGALKSMAAFGNPSSIEFAAKLLHDRYHDVRLEAVNALGQIADPRSLEAIKAALTDKTAMVREAAEKACRRMEQDGADRK